MGARRWAGGTPGTSDVQRVGALFSHPACVLPCLCPALCPGGSCCPRHGNPFLPLSPQNKGLAPASHWGWSPSVPPSLLSPITLPAPVSVSRPFIKGLSKKPFEMDVSLLSRTLAETGNTWRRVWEGDCASGGGVLEESGGLTLPGTGVYT